MKAPLWRRSRLTTPPPCWLSVLRAFSALYRLAVEPGAPRLSEPHPSGTIEHVVLCRGRARLGPAGRPVALSAGDYASDSADEAHVFEALEPGTTAVMLIEHT